MSVKPPEMQWVTSLGGPLIVLSESARSLWRGSDGPDGLSDYDRACEQSFEFVSVIDVGDEQGVVFGDEPNPTIVWHDSTGAIAIARVIAAESDAEAERYLRSVVGSIASPITVRFNVNEDLWLFDAVFPGDKLPEDSARLSVTPGRYGLTESTVEDASNDMVVHVLRKA